MNDLNELMKQLQALEAAVADANPQPSPPVAAPPAPATTLPPEVYAQLRALQQGAARPMRLPDNLASFDPGKLERTLRGEIQLVNQNVASLHAQFQTLAIAMQAMVRKVSAALEDAMKARAAPRRQKPPPLPPSARSEDVSDWDRTQTRVDIPALMVAADGGVIPRSADGPPKAAGPSDATSPGSVFRPSSSAPDGGRAPDLNAGGDLTK